MSLEEKTFRFIESQSVPRTLDAIATAIGETRKKTFVALCALYARGLAQKFTLEASNGNDVLEEMGVAFWVASKTMEQLITAWHDEPLLESIIKEANNG